MSLLSEIASPLITAFMVALTLDSLTDFFSDISDFDDFFSDNSLVLTGDFFSLLANAIATIKTAKIRNLTAYMVDET